MKQTVSSFFLHLFTSIITALKPNSGQNGDKLVTAMVQRETLVNDTRARRGRHKLNEGPYNDQNRRHCTKCNKPFVDWSNVNEQCTSG